MGNFQALKIESYFDNDPGRAVYFENGQYRVHAGITGFVSGGSIDDRVNCQRPKAALSEATMQTFHCHFPA